MTQSLLTHETRDALQRQTFVNDVNPVNGMIADKTQEGVPARIAAVGLALATYCVGGLGFPTTSS